MIRHFSRYMVLAPLMIVLALWLAGCGALVSQSPPVQATGSTAIAHPYPTPQPTHTLYSDSLTQQPTGWASGLACTFTSSGLTVSPSGGQAYICLAPVASTSDYAVSVTTQQRSGATNHAFGIAFRHNAPKNYYFFGINGQGRFTLTVVVNDVSHIVLPFTANAAIHTGTNVANELQVIIKGQTATLLVNKTPVGQATLSTFASGTVGLRGINDGNVMFQKLVISPV